MRKQAGKKIAQELESIRLKNKHHVLNPEDVVRYAERNVESVLHGCFEWDDSVAGEAYRLQQAAAIIRTVVTVIPAGNKEVTVRFYASLPADRGKDGYRDIHTVLTTPDYRQDLLKMAYADLRAFEVKYSILNELAGVFDIVRKLPGYKG